jgi:hypothetical protein
MKKLLIIFALLALVGCGKNTYQLEIDYQGAWSGAVDVNSAITSIQGCGNKTISYGEINYIGATIQKMSNDNKTLTVSIIAEKRGYVLGPDKDDTVFTGSTSAEYGVVTIGGEVK